MRTARTVAELRAWRRAAKSTVGFVPTMGFLHQGHLSLVERSRQENDRTVVSVFVNPTQFAPGGDLERYPRDLDRDRVLLEEAGADLLFVPAAAEIYPDGFQSWVEVGSVASPLEGAARPGHFRGVATVVLKLFNLVRPDRAYFGEKDFQQLAVIRTLVRDLAVPVEVVGCPTVREEDGLAMSSRNAYLSPAQRRAAPVLHRALRAAAAAWADGERQAEALRRTLRQVLAAEPLAEPEYVSAADPGTLEELDGAVEGEALLSMAVRVGPARLIDNLKLTPSAGPVAGPAFQEIASDV